VARGDVGTVQAHLHELADRVGPGDVLDGYRAMSRATVVRALASGRLSAEQAQALLDLLAG